MSNGVLFVIEQLGVALQVAQQQLEQAQQQLAASQARLAELDPPPEHGS